MIKIIKEKFLDQKRKKTIITKYNILNTVIEFGIFIKKEAISETKFNEELGVGAKTPWWSDEGPDFILKLLEKKHKIIYDPSYYIFHPNPIKIYDDKSINRSYKYGCGRGKFLQINHYPFWFVLYVWSLYLAGIFIGLTQFNFSKSKYYFWGLKGRIKGYLDYNKYD